LLSDGLEGAATPIEEDPVLSEADKEAMFQRQAARIKTDDYRRERMLYRAAKATGTPVEELMQQPEWAGVGEARSEDNVMPMQARAAMAQKRMDDENARMEQWKSQMMLASSNSRANMSNAFGMLSPEQQQRVIESRMTGNRNYNGDPRMAIAQLEAETRRAEGQDARAAAAENNSAARQEGREEREAVRAAEELKYNARNAEEKMRHEGLMAQANQRHEAMMAQMQAGNTAAAQAHATELAKITAMMQENKARNEATVAGQKLAADAQVESARINAGVLTEKIGATEQQLEEKAKQLATEQQLAISERAFGPGVRDIAGKQYENPAAVETLSAIAKQANKSWTGFWEADAQRMDAILYRLGVTDPAVRHKLVEDHGLNARGTASVPSYYLHGTPRYATYAPPAAP
jgi:hypothetical protein